MAGCGTELGTRSQWCRRRRAPSAGAFKPVVRPTDTTPGALEPRIIFPGRVWAFRTPFSDQRSSTMASNGAANPTAAATTATAPAGSAAGPEANGTTSTAVAPAKNGGAKRRSGGRGRGNSSPSDNNFTMLLGPRGDVQVSVVVLRHQGNSGRHPQYPNRFYFQARIRNSYPQKHIWSGWAVRDASCAPPPPPPPPPPAPPPARRHPTAYIDLALTQGYPGMCSGGAAWVQTREEVQGHVEALMAERSAHASEAARKKSKAQAAPAAANTRAAGKRKRGAAAQEEAAAAEEEEEEEEEEEAADGAAAADEATTAPAASTVTVPAPLKKRQWTGM